MTAQALSLPSPEAEAAATAPLAGTGPLPAAGRRIGYVMNGFPRLSETFIAHEIHQLERQGLGLRLFVVKREDEPWQHPVVQAISAVREHLPPVSSLSGTSLWPWLRKNAPRYATAHGRVLRRHPLRWLRTAASALALAVQHGQRGALASQAGGFSLRKVYIKEFLQAGHVADAVLRSGDIEHLHGHFCHGVATITWWASQMSAVPFSFTAHAKDIYQAELNPGRLLERKLGAARFVATCTCANAQVLKGRHPRPEEVHAIYHGLDTDWFAPKPQGAALVGDTAHPTAPSTASPTASPTAAPLILAVGRLVEKKGFDTLLHACAWLQANGVAWRCHIVGEDGPAAPALRALIEQLGLQGQVQLVGPMTQDQLRNRYADAHVFALPCQVMADGDRDGFPNVLAEAMAMGVPVVSTAISGIPEMIDDGVHGLLVPPRDPPALGAALQRLLVDTGLHQRLARQGRERMCERFDSRRTTQELRALFEASLAARTRRRGAAVVGQPSEST